MINNKRILNTIYVFILLITVNCSGDAIKPESGQWQGDKNKSLSFVVDAKMIKDFSIYASRSAYESCTVNVSQIPIKKNGTFSFNEPNDYFSISGKFTTPNSVQGEIIINYCAPSTEGGNAARFLVPLEKKWTALIK